MRSRRNSATRFDLSIASVLSLAIKPNPLFARYDKKGTCRVTLDDIANASENILEGAGASLERFL